jgi:ubiquinone/menaquinone biosynthesis C-methylase UbiE
METRQGVLSQDYHNGRKKNRALRYRLQRRANEVFEGIAKYKGHEIDGLLDLGTADAMMLNMLNCRLSIRTPVGIDFSRELLANGNDSNVGLIQGDAIRLPFKDASFDVVVATAVIEHVPEPSTMVSECLRILRAKGICIMTTPDPFFEHIATRIGHLKDDQHVETFNLYKFKILLEDQGFKILKAYKFMISPIGLPLENEIEDGIRWLGLDGLLQNQAIIAEKSQPI